MKRGESSTAALENILDIVLKGLQIIPVLLVLGALWYIFIADDSEEQLQDFRRVVADMEFLFTADIDSVIVPVMSKKSFTLYTFVKNGPNSRRYCDGKHCICMWQAEDNRRECKSYDDSDGKFKGFRFARTQTLTVPESDQTVIVRKRSDGIALG